MKLEKWLKTLGWAYLIDRLFSRKPTPLMGEMTMELKYTPGPPIEKIKFEAPSDILCPYCKYRFGEMPKRSQKCPTCKKYIYRVKDYDKKTYQLITEEDHSNEAEKDAKEQWAESLKYARSTLRRFKQSGIKRVKISGSGESSCPACRTQSGKVYLIEDALKEMPIPCKDCTFALHGLQTKIGWCRCVYLAKFS